MVLVRRSGRLSLRSSEACLVRWMSASQPASQPASTHVVVNPTQGPLYPVQSGSNQPDLVGDGHRRPACEWFPHQTEAQTRILVCDHPATRKGRVTLLRSAADACRDLPRGSSTGLVDFVVVFWCPSLL